MTPLHVLIVYESMFGNTREIAGAIAGGLRDRCMVELAEAGTASDRLDDPPDLLVVGGPTHAFSMTRASTRRSAADQTPDPLVSGGRGVREWLAALAVPAGTLAATFDTRIARPRFPGSAARSAARRLRAKGMEVIDTESFYVAASLGPLVDGECERARRWGRSLGERLQVTIGGPVAASRQ
jgi:hypothetical protein